MASVCCFPFLVLLGWLLTYVACSRFTAGSLGVCRMLQPAVSADYGPVHMSCTLMPPGSRCAWCRHGACLWTHVSRRCWSSSVGSSRRWRWLQRARLPSPAAAGGWPICLAVSPAAPGAQPGPTSRAGACCSRRWARRQPSSSRSGEACSAKRPGVQPLRFQQSGWRAGSVRW